MKVSSEKKSEKTEQPAKTSSEKPAAKGIPTYIVMVTEAIKNLKDRKGSSRMAIEKYISANYPVSDNFAVHMKAAMKKGIEKEIIIIVKGKGLNGMFKLAKVEPAKKPATQPKATGIAAKKAAIKRAQKGGKAPKKALAPKTAKKTGPAEPKTPVKKAPKAKTARKTAAVPVPSSPAKKVPASPAKKAKAATKVAKKQEATPKKAKAPLPKRVRDLQAPVTPKKVKSTKGTAGPKGTPIKKAGGRGQQRTRGAKK